MTNHEDNDLDFASLSVKDLIEARDLFHFHLMSKANVVGTAIGLYLIRGEEDWPKKRGEGTSPKNKKTYPRTFENSEVRDYSWPCIIVLVREWLEPGDFGQENRPAATAILPKRVYLPDGRIVPICVVVAPPVPQSNDMPTKAVRWPNSGLGGGLPLRVTTQNEDHFATIGCLVSDGSTTYALTARHACGEPGTPVYASLRTTDVKIGVSSNRQITREPFSEIYPALPMRQTWLGVDVGLVRLDDTRLWTSNIYFLPKIKPIFDIYEQNLSLRKLIDQGVVAVGGASGLLKGKIKAMFYRYKSVGGFDFVSDFLIAPHKGSMAHHGDSGAVWHLQMSGKNGDKQLPLMEQDLRPIAVEWGAQVFAGSGTRSTFSVATSLSNVCKLLDVELLVEANEGVSGTWGAEGHYSIGSLAIGQVQDPILKAFLLENADLISIPLDRLSDEQTQAEMIASGFVQLADVPDIVWKKYASPHLTAKGKDIGVKGGRDDRAGAGGRSTGPEHPNHHFDADMPWRGHDTFIEAWRADNSLLTAENVKEYFLDNGKKSVLEMGLLPFRVWQFFERMKTFAATDPAKFLAAAGTFAHFVGDASQPLHGSHLSDGDKTKEPDIPRLSDHKGRDGNHPPAHRGEGVHSAFETDMISWAINRGFLFDAIREMLGSTVNWPAIATGKHAAEATMRLMEKVRTDLSPTVIIDAYEDTFHPGAPPHSKALWEAIGLKTGLVMAEGVKLLATLWEQAWLAGGGNTNAGRVDREILRSHYENQSFVKSVFIDEIMNEIAHPSDG
ncbi:S1/P1 Nuclease [Rhizobium sp. NZLR8]|uniref:hypothetical protein n=1 Tax=Rhizobium sp. NZLR8 TaxID=2731104 RepID=UPI001C830524|nr:hypothetical protein [Rhizobium sp. NZLR8]MBX5157678.1 S1/P1 Nuclease [Rhizobium sp. NZLR8]